MATIEEAKESILEKIANAQLASSSVRELAEAYKMLCETQTTSYNGYNPSYGFQPPQYPIVSDGHIGVTCKDLR